MPVFGPTKALIVAVVKRSNSRNCGTISALVVTNASGISSRTIAAARRSCSGFRYEKRKQTATASTPSLAQLAGRGPDLVLVERHEHLAVGGTIRSVTTFRWRRCTNGFACQGMSCSTE